MNIKDIAKVNRLVQSLNEKVKTHEALKELLKPSTYGNNQVRLEIGGDTYGNGRYTTVTTDIQDVKYVVDLLNKRKDAVWSEIVSIRMALRELGVGP